MLAVMTITDTLLASAVGAITGVVPVVLKTLLDRKGDVEKAKFAFRLPKQAEIAAELFSRSIDLERRVHQYFIAKLSIVVVKEPEIKKTREIRSIEIHQLLQDEIRELAAYMHKNTFYFKEGVSEQIKALLKTAADTGLAISSTPKEVVSEIKAKEQEVSLLQKKLESEIAKIEAEFKDMLGVINKVGSPPKE